MKVLCFCGGVGGAKLAYGFSRLLKADELTIVVNTGDDFEHLGFHISPDIDTVIYNLAGINNQTLGWGIEGETWEFMRHIEKEEKETWFKLGDKDLKTHQLRKHWLSEGKTLGEATQALCQHYGVRHPVIPMSDDRVSTVVRTANGKLPFQHYFVREQCKPAVTGFEFDGISTARPSPLFMKALDDRGLSAVVICPSNPFVSIDPILSLHGVREKLQSLKAPVIAVSPIIGGKAIKGPAAKMMQELDIPCSSLSIAWHYRGMVGQMVIDNSDLAEQPLIEQSGMRCLVTNTLMHTDTDKQTLARYIIDTLQRN